VINLGEAPGLATAAGVGLRARVGVTALVSLLGVAAAEGVHAACPAGADEKVVVELFFGRNIAARTGVSEQAFRRFVDQQVTPRFPDGFTIFDTRGQYRQRNSMQIIREPGKYMLIALGDEARDWPRVVEMVAVYKRAFEQQSVGVISRRSCVMF
jgi:hypothetical protein